jgi:hypothetical protein
MSLKIGTQLGSYDRGAYDGAGPYHGFAAAIKDASRRRIGNAPCQKPPWGRLLAVNANTGDIAWQVTLGLKTVRRRDCSRFGGGVYVAVAGVSRSAGIMLIKRIILLNNTPAEAAPRLSPPQLRRGAIKRIKGRYLC